MKSLSFLPFLLLIPFFLWSDESQPDWEKNFPVDRTSVGEQEMPRISSYADVLDPARDAVVSVTTASIVQSMRFGRNPLEERLRQFYGIPDDPRNAESDEERRVYNGQGSGVIISDDGYILTNNHVIVAENGETADEITVTLNDGRDVEATLVGRDERTDIALIKIDVEDEKLAYIPLTDSDLLRVGDIVFAIGNPLGVGQTTTMGIVSATGRSNLRVLGNQGYENFIQTDAAINQGNSGGALIDAEGRLVGINSAIISGTGGNIGIGFAIPINLARNIAIQLLSYGEVRRGYLGVQIGNLTPDLVEAFGLEEGTQGALVEEVQPNTPAADAGLQSGDVIVAINDRVVETYTDLRLLVASILPGSEVKVTYLRDGSQETVYVTLATLDNSVAAAPTPSRPQRQPLEGVELLPLDEELAERWSIVDLDKGVLVNRVDARSPFQRLQPGMVILEINDEAVNNLRDVRQSLREGRANKLWIYFRGNRVFMALRLP